MKFFLWLGKMALASVMIASLTVFVTWTTVQTYLDKVLAHYQLGEGMGKIEFSDLLSEMSSSLNIMKQPAAGGTKSKGAAGNVSTGTGAADGQTSANAGRTPGSDGENLAAAAAGESGSSGLQGTGTGAADGSTAGSGSASGTGTGGAVTGSAGSDAGTGSSTGGGGSGGGSGNGGTSSGGGAAAHAQEEPDHTGDAVPVWSQSGSKVNSDASGTGKKLAVSSDSFQSMKDKISNEDKMKLFSLLVTKLPEQDVQTISQLVEDGITNDELNQIDAIIQKSLSKEEYKEVLAILQKYE